MANTISAAKFNEITNAIGQLQSILGYDSNASERVYSRYPATIVAAYKTRCAEMDAEDAAHSDTPGTY